MTDLTRKEEIRDAVQLDLFAEYSRQNSDAWSKKLQKDLNELDLNEVKSRLNTLQETPTAGETLEELARWTRQIEDAYQRLAAARQKIALAAYYKNAEKQKIWSSDLRLKITPSNAPAEYLNSLRRKGTGLHQDWEKISEDYYLGFLKSLADSIRESMPSMPRKEKKAVHE